jgi:hypothetical protein
MRMQLIIDRFEGDYAICEKSDRSMIKFQRRKIPLEAIEGDVLQGDGDCWQIDAAATAARKKAAKELFQKLRQPDQG